MVVIIPNICGMDMVIGAFVRVAPIVLVSGMTDYNSLKPWWFCDEKHVLSCCAGRDTL